MAAVGALQRWRAGGEFPHSVARRAGAVGARAAVAAVALAVAACGGAVSPEWAGPELQASAFCKQPLDEVERRVGDLLARMTLEEKIEQMHGAGPKAARGLWPTPDNERLGIPGFRMVDGPRGVHAATGNATAFPVAIARAAAWDPALEERVGEAIGAEVRAKGGSVLLAPVLNVLRHPRWGRSQETYGEDPFLVGSLGVAFIRGAQRHVVASAKHFAAYSIENTRFRVDVQVDERTLREVYLPHFRMAVDEGGAASVMSAYNKVNGQYCAENEHLVRDILKAEWGFQGFVESDWFLGARSTVPSVLAGLDIEMPRPLFYGPALLRAVESGSVPLDAVDEAVRRILRVKLCFRLDSDPPVPDPEVVESARHTRLSLEVARRGIVLLTNEGVLPLDRARLRSLAVVGSLADQPNLGDDGSSEVAPSYAVTPLAGIRARGGGVEVRHVPALDAEGTAAVERADAAVVVVGLTKADEGEAQVSAGDRKGLRLSAADESLVQAVASLNPATIVVLEGGGPIVVEPWIDAVGALVLAWYPGLEGGNAIAEVLFGDTNPSGRLPATFPRAEADLPPFDSELPAVRYEYDHGYRYLDRHGIEPRFPFGFGLSYTAFRYERLEIAEPVLAPDGVQRLRVTVTNTGPRAGEETVQVYVAYEGSRVVRPVRDLKAFAKVFLEPGESRAISLAIPARRLAYYDEESRSWQVEAIVYRASAGPNSRELPLEARFSVAAPLSYR